MKTIRVGSRASKLAVIQAQMVIDAIQAEHPEIRCELVTRSSQGDRDHSKPLDAFESETLFTNELDRSLAQGEIDFAVHSFKDLPIYDNEDLPIVAVSPRENPFDALVLSPYAKKNQQKPYGASCRRRVLQFRQLYPEYTTATIRGSVDSRIQQMEEGAYDGLILAVAGLKRLGLEEKISRIFTLEEMIPSACQGILAVQGRRGEDYSYLREFHGHQTDLASRAERSFLRELSQGNSSYNNGVYAEIEKDTLTITGMILTKDDTMIRDVLSGPMELGEALGQALAKKLVKAGTIDG